MKKSEPKMILNVTIDNNEFEEKVKIATNKYVEQLVLKDLDDTISRIIENRINKLISGRSWEEDNKIQGVSLETFVKQKTENTLSDFIDKNAKQLLAKKIADII